MPCCKPPRPTLPPPPLKKPPAVAFLASRLPWGMYLVLHFHVMLPCSGWLRLQQASILLVLAVKEVGSTRSLSLMWHTPAHPYPCLNSLLCNPRSTGTQSTYFRRHPRTTSRGIAHNQVPCTIYCIP